MSEQRGVGSEGRGAGSGYAHALVHGRSRDPTKCRPQIQVCKGKLRKEEVRNSVTAKQRPSGPLPTPHSPLPTPRPSLPLFEPSKVHRQEVNIVVSCVFVEHANFSILHFSHRAVGKLSGNE